jgi:hypothetical protein
MPVARPLGTLSPFEREHVRATTTHLPTRGGHVEAAMWWPEESFEEFSLVDRVRI